MNRRIFTNEIGTVAIWAFDGDRRNIANGKFRIVVIGAQNNRRQGIGASFFGAGPNARGPTDIAYGIGIDLGRNRSRNFANRHIVLDKRQRGYFDQCLWRRDPSDRGPCHTCRKETCDHLIRKARQLIDTHRPRDDHIAHAIRPACSTDHRVIGLFGQRANRAQRGINVFLCLIEVVVSLKLQIDPRGPFGGTAFARRYTFNTEENGFKNLNHGPIDVLSPCPIPRHANADGFRDDIRKELGPHFWKRDQSRDDHNDHQQIRGSAVAREIR